jgi:hypothetical protein
MLAAISGCDHDVANPESEIHNSASPRLATSIIEVF